MNNNCPRCGRPIVGHPAISRDDNSTEICSDCGVEQALEAFANFKKGYTTVEHNGYTVVLSPDGYLHHAVVGKRLAYPIVLDKESGEFRNECGNIKLDEFQEKLESRTAMWG